MLSKFFKISLLILVVGWAAGMLVVLRMDNARLRRQVAERRGKAERLGRVRAETRHHQELLARASASEAGSADAIHADLLQAREEIAALENRAHAAHLRKSAQNAVEAEAMANNRDPGRGLTRLEHFQPAGQDTPGAAFQTLVWAALQGKEAELSRVVGLTEPARVQAQSFIDSLPEETRGQWTPEKIGAMFLTALLTEVPAIQLLDATIEADGQRATLAVRVPQPSNAQAIQRVPMQRGAGGWQVTVSEGQIERVKKKLQNAENLPASK